MVPVACNVVLGFATETGIGSCKGVYFKLELEASKWSVCARLTKLIPQQLSMGNGNCKPPDSMRVQRMFLFARCGSVFTVQV